MAPRCGAFVGYGLGPTTISKAAHDSRTPIAGSKSEIGTYQYSKRYAPFDLIDLLLWLSSSHPKHLILIENDISCQILCFDKLISYGLIE